MPRPCLSSRAVRPSTGAVEAAKFVEGAQQQHQHAWCLDLVCHVVGSHVECPMLRSRCSHSCCYETCYERQHRHTFNVLESQWSIPLPSDAYQPRDAWLVIKNPSSLDQPVAYFACSCNHQHAWNTSYYYYLCWHPAWWATDSHPLCMTAVASHAWLQIHTIDTGEASKCLNWFKYCSVYRLFGYTSILGAIVDPLDWMMANGKSRTREPSL